MPPAVKDRFHNRSGGIIGAVIEAPGGGYKGIPVYPDETVDLDEVEQAMTANAPRSPTDNPLANGALVAVSEGLDFRGRRPLRPDGSVELLSAPPEVATPTSGGLGEETATVIESPGAPPEGHFADGEEVATPDTQEVPNMARKGPPAAVRPGQARARPRN